MELLQDEERPREGAELRLDDARRPTLARIEWDPPTLVSPARGCRPADFVFSPSPHTPPAQPPAPAGAPSLPPQSSARKRRRSSTSHLSPLSYTSKKVDLATFDHQQAPASFYPAAPTGEPSPSRAAQKGKAKLSRVERLEERQRNGDDSSSDYVLELDSDELDSDASEASDLDEWEGAGVEARWRQGVDDLSAAELGCGGERRGKGKPIRGPPQQPLGSIRDVDVSKVDPAVLAQFYGRLAASPELLGRLGEFVDTVREERTPLDQLEHVFRRVMPPAASEGFAPCASGASPSCSLPPFLGLDDLILEKQRILASPEPEEVELAHALLRLAQHRGLDPLSDEMSTLEAELSSFVSPALIPMTFILLECVPPKGDAAFSSVPGVALDRGPTARETQVLMPLLKHLVPERAFHFEDCYRSCVGAWNRALFEAKFGTAPQSKVDWADELRTVSSLFLQAIVESATISGLKLESIIAGGGNTSKLLGVDDAGRVAQGVRSGSTLFPNVVILPAWHPTVAMRTSDPWLAAYLFVLKFASTITLVAPHLPLRATSSQLYETYRKSNTLKIASRGGMPTFDELTKKLTWSSEALSVEKIITLCKARIAARVHLRGGVPMGRVRKAADGMDEGSSEDRAVKKVKLTAAGEALEAHSGKSTVTPAPDAPAKRKPARPANETCGLPLANGAVCAHSLSSSTKWTMHGVRETHRRQEHPDLPPAPNAPSVPPPEKCGLMRRNGKICEVILKASTKWIMPGVRETHRRQEHPDLPPAPDATSVPPPEKCGLMRRNGKICGVILKASRKHAMPGVRETHRRQVHPDLPPAPDATSVSRLRLAGRT